MKELSGKQCVKEQGFCKKLNSYYNTGGRIGHSLNDNWSE